MKPVIPALSQATSCSSCFLQDRTLKHIDFDTALDRGYTYGDAGKIQMDDLILCENCIREAGKLCGLVDEGSKSAKVNELTSRLAEAERQREAQEQYAGRLEDAFDAREPAVRVNHRKRPRQKRSSDTNTDEKD